MSARIALSGADIRAASPGTRFVLPRLMLTRRTTYERLIHGQETRVIWRYEFHTLCDGFRVVYSGSHLLGLKINDTCYIKATIKKQEPQWGCTRIARPRVLTQADLPLPF
jgi:hypothetical protein